MEPDRFPILEPSLPQTAPEWAGFLCNDAAARIREKTAACLCALELSPRMFIELEAIAAGGAPSQIEVGAMLGIDRTTMVQILDYLEGKGWLERTVNPEDRRVRALGLTPAGQKMWRQARMKVTEAQAEFLAPLSSTEWEQLREMLIRLGGNR